MENMDLGEVKTYKNIGDAMCLLELISCGVFIFFCMRKYQALNYPMLLIRYMIFLLVSMLTLSIIRGCVKIVNIQKRFANDIMEVKSLVAMTDALTLSNIKNTTKLKTEYMFSVWRGLFLLGTILFLATSFTKIL